MGKNNQFLTKAGIGAFIVFMGLVLMTLGVDRLIVITTINAGLIAIVFSLFYHFRFKGKVYQDERTKKIGMQSLAYSWMGTFALVGLLSWVQTLAKIQLTAETTLSIIMIFMAVTGSALQLYLSRKPEFE